MPENTRNIDCPSCNTRFPVVLWDEHGVLSNLDGIQVAPTKAQGLTLSPECEDILHDYHSECKGENCDCWCHKRN